MAILPKNHPIAKKSFVTLNDLSKEKFLLMEEGGNSILLEAFKEANLNLTVKIRIHDDYTIMSMVEQGMGVSILPNLVLRKTSYDIEILPIKPKITRKLGLISKNKNELSIASKYFIEFMLSNIDKLP